MKPGLKMDLWKKVGGGGRHCDFIKDKIFLFFSPFLLDMKNMWWTLLSSYLFIHFSCLPYVDILLQLDRVVIFDLALSRASPQALIFAIG